MLGAGGMAVVYKAEDAMLGRCVALKMLHSRYAVEDSFRLRFKQEARAMASLDHENIVKVYDISQDDEIPFIVAEYVGGQDMGSMLKEAPEGRLGERFTRRLAEQLLVALAYAHQRGVIHCDIKPSNLLIAQGDLIKVADFGIARIAEEEEVGEPGEVIGSARYMSPEQLQGEETTPRSDLYSVGILLYHCLTGRLPFSGDTKSVARQQIHNYPTPPRVLNEEISPQLEAVILKALTKRVEDRYPSASAMLEDLHKDAKVEGSYETAGPSSHWHGERGEGRKALLAFSTLALLLLLGGGTAVASLGYVGLGDLPLLGRTEEALTPAQLEMGDLPEAPDVVLQEPEQQQGTEQQGTAQGDSQDPNYTLVPSVDAYFDWYAEETLQSRGFQTQVIYEYREGYAPRGVTWGTDPVVGTLLPVGSTVTVYATPNDQAQTQPLPPSQQPQPSLPQTQPQTQPQPPPQRQPSLPQTQPQPPRL